MGEDVGKNGGVFRATEGLLLFLRRVRRESRDRHAARGVGDRRHGDGNGRLRMRPVPEIQFMGFIYPAFDQIVSHAARTPDSSRGRYTCPMVIRAPYGGGIRAPEHHLSRRRRCSSTSLD